MRASRRAQGAGAAIAAIAGVLAAALIVGLAGRQARLLAGPAVLRQDRRRVSSACWRSRMHARRCLRI
jgi:hypothetical protein